MRFFLILSFIALPFGAWAQMDLTSSKEPVAIEASGQLEWLRDKNMYRADKDVMITQGTTTIKGDTAEAFYDPVQGSSALTTITVKGNVTIIDKDQTIVASEADYDVIKQILNLRGDTVTITAPNMSVIAHEGVDYYAAERKAVAKGKAEVKQADQTLRANSITAWFTEGNKIDRAEARGNVVIVRKTPQGDDIAQADQGDYSPGKDSAVLRGNVKLTQGDNHMQGDVATINLKTGYSTLKNTGSTGRVRAIFVPGGNSPAPNLTATVPMPNAKKEFQPASSSVGKRS
jgi:lipopolysaccharide export system protein LptA